MVRKNGFSEVSQAAIERVQTIARDFMSAEIAEEARKRLIEELKFHEETLIQAFDFRKMHGPEMSPADSDGYFREKLGGMMSFAKMALDPSSRESYDEDKIIENVGHYSYLVARLVVARWTSQSKRPVSDRTIKDSSFENRDALQRLANR